MSEKALSILDVLYLGGGIDTSTYLFWEVYIPLGIAAFIGGLWLLCTVWDKVDNWRWKKKKGKKD